MLQCDNNTKICMYVLYLFVVSLVVYYYKGTWPNPALAWAKEILIHEATTTVQIRKQIII